MISRVGVGIRRRLVGLVPGAGGMSATGETDENRPLLDAVAWLSVGRTPVDGMLVMEAAAHRIELDQLVTHGESVERWVAQKSRYCPVAISILFMRVWRLDEE